MIGVVLALSIRRGAVVAERLALAVGVGELEVEGGPVALTLQITLPGRAPYLTCKISILSLNSILHEVNKAGHCIQVVPSAHRLGCVDLAFHPNLTGLLGIGQKELCS